MPLFSFFFFLLPLSTQLAERRINFKINGQQVQNKRIVKKRKKEHSDALSSSFFFLSLSIVGDPTLSPAKTMLTTAITTTRTTTTLMTTTTPTMETVLLKTKTMTL